jgi:DegV family protein with EDD domain
LFSSGLGYMVAEATEMALAGASRGTIVEQLLWRRERTALFIAVDTLDFLRRSGRVNFFQAGIASVLNIKPILGVEEGRLEVAGRVRSRQKSLERLIEMAVESASDFDGPIWASAMHGNAAAEAQWLLDQLARRLPVERSFISEAPASIALHGGPGVVAVLVTVAGPRTWQ